MAVHHAICFQFELGDGNAHARAGSGVLKMHPAFDRRTARIELQIIVVDETLRHLHKRHIAGEPAIVIPIRIQSRNTVGLPGIVYRDNGEVLPRMQQFGDFAIEWSVAAFVFAYRLSVDRKNGFIVCRANMKENSAMLARLVVEVPLIPDHPFVIEQRIALSIPVARHFERGRFAEIVLHQLVVSGDRCFVQNVPVMTQFTMERKQAVGIWIDHCVPIAVQAHALAVIHVDQNCWV